MSNRCHTPVCIHANTEVIQKALNERGYKHRIRYSAKPDFDENKMPCIYCYKNSWVCGSEEMKQFIEKAEQLKNPDFKFVDCGTNITMFLAMAAYSIHHDKFQLFTNGVRWHLCDALKWAGSSRFHKATPQEIIRKYSGNVQ